MGKEERDEVNIGEVLKADKELDRKERWERIRESKYNKWYSWIKGKKEGVPEYLKKGWGEKRWQRVSKYRLGNGMRENEYWREEEERKCRVCGVGKETWEHVWEECMKW